MRVFMRFTVWLLLLALTCGGCTGKSDTKKPITSIEQLNDSSRTIAVSENGAPFDAVKRDLPKAKRVHIDGQPAYDAVKMGKVDAYAYERAQMEIAIADGLKGVRLLDGNIGENVKIAVGLSPASKIDGLQKKINSFIAESRASGLLDDMHSRWVITGNRRMPDIDVPSSSGIRLVVGTSGLVMPYSYYEGEKLTGYDIEFARRFAKWLGAEVEFRIYDYGGLITAAATGEIDCVMANLNMTPERAEKIKFSDVLYTAEVALMVKDDSPVTAQQTYSSVQDLNGKRIGVLTGSIGGEIVKGVLPAAEVSYHDNYANMTSALSSGKIDALLEDDFVVLELEHNNPDFKHIDGYLRTFDKAFIFTKSPEGDKIRNQFNEFLRTIKADGTLKKISDVWIGFDESRKTLPDYENYPATNGIIKFAVDNTTPTFSYVKDGRIVGYDVDLLARFCKAYGYRPEPSPMNFSAELSAVNSGKCLVGISAIAITPERAESVNFTEPVYTGGAMLLVRKSPEELKPASSPSHYSTLADLSGQRIGVHTGVDEWAQIVNKLIPDAKIIYYNSLADLAAALESRKIDAFPADSPVVALLRAENSNIAVLGERLEDSIDIAVALQKSEKGEKLKAQWDEYITRITNSGELDSLLQKWTSSAMKDATPPDYESLPAVNGKLMMAADAEDSPLSYYSGNKLTGFEIELATEFCRAYSYGLTIHPMTYEAVLAAIRSGKYDFALAMLAPSDEHSESVLFSIPYYACATDMVIRKDAEPHKSAAKFMGINDLAGKRIGVQTGTTNDKAASKAIPDAAIEYFDSFADVLVALRLGKIEAACLALNAARFMLLSNEDLAVLDKPLAELDAAPVFAKTEAGRKLCGQFNGFIKAQWDNGTFQRMDAVWFGQDESKRTVKDYTSLPAPNGTLKMAVDTSLAPFTYVKNNRIVGYEVEMAVKFCEENGYGLEVVPMSFSAIIPAVVSGKCDFASCTIAVTAERAEQVLFAYPNAKTGNVIVVRKSDTESEPAPKTSARFTDIQDLAGKRIAVQTGMVHDKILADVLPSAQLVYFDSQTDLVTALRTNKVDAFCTDIPTAKFMMTGYSSMTQLGAQLTTEEAAPIFPKNEAGRQLCEQFTEFTKAAWDNGTIHELEAIWYGSDDSRRVVKDYSQLPAPNGMLKMAADISVVPFTYIKDNRIVGYDVDFAVRFCEKYGYGLEVIPMSWTGIIPSVMSGKCDFAANSIFITEERAESVLFSYPNIKSGTGLFVRKADVIPQSPAKTAGFAEMAGKKIGVETGALSAQLIAEQIPTAQIEYFQALTDALIALKLGKIDALASTVLAARHMMNENEELEYLDEWLRTADIMPVFTPSDRGRKILEEYSSFIKGLWDDGTIDRLYELWLGKDESKKVIIDYSSLPATNGVIRIAVDTAMPPLAYVRDGVVVGYDVDLAARFCEAKGYGLEVTQTNIAGMIAAVQSGKCDMSQSMNYTEERAQSVLFSPTATVHAGNVIVVRKAVTEAPKIAPAVSATAAPTAPNTPTFLDELAASFNRTFIREDRWRLFIEGIINTMIITVLSIICGTILGFVVYLFCRGGNVIANLITRFFVWLIQGTPMVVLLMILYYIIFGKVDIAGIWVAVIAFTLTFGAGVYGMLCSGVNALDRGQTEAAYALGFTDRRTFFTVILPQAALHFMPSYKAEVVALIKATAIVGYIAVQDLTKMGDIVRSRTYEAFFPLIAVAVIYFVLAGVLNMIVGMIHNRIRPEKRTRDDILRGIKTHD